MAENSLIAWTDHTWNPWRGCTKVSEACKNCYAEVLSLRYGMPPYQKGIPRKRLSEDNWKKPYRWNKSVFDSSCGDCDPCIGGRKDQCAVSRPRRPRVFSLSLGDWLDDEVPIEWLADMLKVIHNTPNLDWLLLTKRPENWRQRVHLARESLFTELMEKTLGDPMTMPYTHRERVRDWLTKWLEQDDPPQNVRIGITAENQKRFDERWRHAAAIPAVSRFISIEPMLEEINIGEAVCEEPPKGYQMLSRFYKGNEFDPTGSQPKRTLWLKKEKLFHQIIVGGESGAEHKERTLNLDAVRNMHDQCRAAGIAFFMKQDSGPRPGMRGRIPDDLWIQEFPT